MLSLIAQLIWSSFILNFFGFLELPYFLSSFKNFKCNVYSVVQVLDSKRRIRVFVFN